MDVKLVMFKRDGQRKDFPIQQTNTVIGRGDECALRIPLLSVSRRHCELVKGQDEVRLRDLASSNGTHVNNRRINETVLKPGDRVVIGPVIFTVQIDGTPQEIRPVRTKARKAAQATQPAPPPPPPGEEEVVELEADVAAVGEETDPIAALEALAAQHRPKEENQEKDKEKKK
jgi:pSer/pThr/pTyr-binding forkhead associated (FHA) protein